MNQKVTGSVPFQGTCLGCRPDPQWATSSFEGKQEATDGCLFYFFKYILLIMLLQLLHFPSCIPLRPEHPLAPSSSLLVHVHGSYIDMYKFFGFYISYTILNLPLSIFCLPFMLLIPCTFSPISSSPSSLITLHGISISVILFLF